MRNSIFAFFAGLISLISGVVQAPQNLSNSSPIQIPSPASIQITKVEDINKEDIILLVNNERSKARLPLLTNNNKLDNAANAITKDILAKGYWSTSRPDGTPLWSFITAAGYKYLNASVDLGKDFTNSQSLVDSWMQNSADRESILKISSNDIGIGIEKAKFLGYETTIVVQVIANTSIQPQVLTNNNARSSNNSVSLKDPDPYITCNSKTGNITVKLSVCNTYTDCPNGYGGYVFESQEACKSRWSKIGSDLKNVNDQFIQAMKEKSDLNSQEKLQEQTDDTSKFTSDLEAKTRADNQRVLQEQSDYFKNLIKEPSPTPTPQQGGGRLLDPYHTSY